MPRRNMREAEAAVLFGPLAASGEDAPTPEEKLAMVGVLRARSDNTGDELDRFLIDRLTSAQEGLHEAHRHLGELRAVHDPEGLDVRNVVAHQPAQSQRLEIIQAARAR